MRVIVLALAALALGCPHHKHDRPEHGEHTEAFAASTAAVLVEHEVETFDTKCWSLADWGKCQHDSCNDTNECCSREQLGCTQHACGASGCAYSQDQADPACACMPGECSADGTSVCGCTQDGGTVTAAAMTACTPDFPRCDPAKRKCVCDPATKSCTANGRGHTFCNADGDKETAQCPNDAPLCEHGDCICSPLKGKKCGCDGHYDCLGNCDRPTCASDQKCDKSLGRCCTSNEGNGCGQCGGHFDCNGRCDRQDPADVFKSCNACNGKRQCDGSCSPAEPATFHDVCPCGGPRDCNGNCASSPPGFLGSCGECGGRVLCNGQCSKPLRRCPSGYNAQGDGTCLFAGATEVHREELSLGGADWDHCGAHCGCEKDERFDIGVSCTGDWVRASIETWKSGGGEGSCDATWATGDPRNCSVRLHFNTKNSNPFKICEHILCTVRVTARDVMPQCSQF